MPGKNDWYVNPEIPGDFTQSLKQYIDTNSSASGVVAGADYVLSVSGSTVTATPAVSSNPTFTGTDGAAVLTSVLGQLSNVGTVVFQPGTYPWGSICQIQRNYASGGTENPKMLRILGQNSRITLSNAGPSFLTFQRLADDDSFANFELGGFIVDAAGQPATGYYHAIIGTTINGVQLGNQRSNFYNMWFHDLRAINLTADTTNPGTANARYGIWIRCDQNATGQANNYMMNMIWERIRVEGGNIGILAGAANSAGSNLGIRVYGGGWVARDCWHSTLTTPSSFFTCSNYQFGVGIATLPGTITASDTAHPSTTGLLCENLYGYGSGDDGLETNGFAQQMHIDCVMEDSWNQGFFTVNSNYVNGIDSSSDARQKIVYMRCMHRVSNNLGNNQNYGWIMQTSFRDVGSIELLDCQYTVKSIVCGASNPFKLAVFHQNVGSFVIRRIKIQNFTASYDSVTNATATGNEIWTFYFNGVGPTELILENCKFTYNGNQASTGAILIKPCKILGSDYRAKIDGISVDDRITNRTAGATRVVEIGESQINAANSRFRGSIKNVKLLNASMSDTSPELVHVYTSTTFTPSGQINISDLDLAGLNGGGYLTVGDATNSPFVKYLKPRSVEAVAFTSSYTPDTTSGMIKNIGALTGAITVNAPNFASYGDELEFLFIQDGTGGRTVSWNATFLFQVAWTNTGNTLGKRSTARFVYNGTNWISTSPVANVWF